MLRCMRLIYTLLIIILIINPLIAQEKRGVGIFPFENLSKQEKFDWISFGLEYLLSNKLSNIAPFMFRKKILSAKRCAKPVIQLKKLVVKWFIMSEKVPASTLA